MGYPAGGARRASPNLGAQDERVGALLGERGRDSGQQAITRADAAGMGVVELRAKILSAAPTAADYNALVADVQAVAGALNRMGAKFTW